MTAKQLGVTQLTPNRRFGKLMWVWVNHALVSTMFGLMGMHGGMIWAISELIQSGAKLEHSTRRSKTLWPFVLARSWEGGSNAANRYQVPRGSAAQGAGWHLLRTSNEREELLQWIGGHWLCENCWVLVQLDLFVGLKHLHLHLLHTGPRLNRVEQWPHPGQQNGILFLLLLGK